MKSYSIHDLNTGDRFEKIFDIEEQMGEKFAELSQDFNPIHLNQDYAEKTMFQGKIAHGMLVASFISGVIGNDFPGEGTIYLKQDLKFVSPVRYGDKIRVCVEVSEIEIERARVTLQTDCYNQNNEKVIAGTALVKVRK